MVGVLSIDFDYFIDVSAKERDRYFPTGSDSIPKDKLKSMWKDRYLKYPKLKEVGLIDDYYKLVNFLRLLYVEEAKCYRSDSHKDIMKILEKIPWNIGIKLVNIDFHHDYYHFYLDGNRLNCGNWLRRFIEKRPDTEVIWIRREDSQILSLEGEFPFKHTTDIESIFHDKYHYVFICRSPEWSPPHLSKYYEELASVIINKTA
ncbi:MAG: hypothetical protein GXY88_08505 [Tissierellia bacterium]|nr:hypothetical protein [Tissierellia bacterium]